MSRVPFLVRSIAAIIFLIFTVGCASVPEETLQIGTAREISWKGVRVTVEVIQCRTGFQVGVEFWAPGFVATSMIAPFEGVRLVLGDGQIVESGSKIPEVIEYSGGPCNAWSEKIVMSFSVPETSIPSRLELRCGLGTLKCAVESEWTLLMRDPDRY